LEVIPVIISTLLLKFVAYLFRKMDKKLFYMQYSFNIIFMLLFTVNTVKFLKTLGSCVVNHKVL